MDRIAREMRDALDALIDVWFPRVVDREHGGFLCDFDHRWRPTGPHTKTLEYQARVLRALCAAASFDPGRSELRDLADGGAAYLRDVMWDDRYGGFFRSLDRSGAPLEGASKHTHGIAYAISALVEHHGISGDTRSLDRARETFDWLEENGRDHENGGYFMAFERAGEPILTPDRAPPGFRIRDVIGTPWGLKDANSICDLMFALALLSRSDVASGVPERVEELFEIVLRRLFVSPGALHNFTLADWTPVPDYSRYGQNLHGANLLRETALRLGGDAMDRARTAIDSIAECTLAYGWDRRRGGFYYAGSTFGQSRMDRDLGSLGEKYWWVQAEGLVALSHRTMAGAGPGAGDPRPLVRLWNYVRTQVIDERRGGWRWIGKDSALETRLPKAGPWKDPSHEVRGLIECIEVLESAEAQPSDDR